MRRLRKIAHFLIVCLATALPWGSPFAMPRGGAPPVAHGGNVVPGDAAPDAGDSAARDPLDRISGSDNVLRVDGVAYSGEIFKSYLRDILERRPADGRELHASLNEMALDVAGYEEALSEMPTLADDMVVVQALSKLKAKLLPAIYIREEVRNKVNPTPEELLAKLPDPPPQYEISVITNQEEARIDEAAKALSQGEPFDNVARTYSDGFTAHKGGKVGAVVEGKYDQFSEAEFRVIKGLKGGEASRPFMTRIGWTIVRLDRFWSSDELKRLDVDRNFAQYKANAEKERMQELNAEIRKRYPVVWNDNNLARIRAAVDNSLLRTDDLRSIEIFRVDGSPVHAPDFFDSMARIHSPDALDIYLDKRERTELLSREAERLGYAKPLEPLLDLARRRAVTREFFRRKSRAFQASDADLREYYEKNSEKFRTEEARRLLVIENPDRKKAEEAHRKAKRGDDFRQLARKYSYRDEARKVGGDVGFVYRKNLDPKVGDKIFRAREGAILPPMEIPGAGGRAVYAVVKVDAVRKAGVRPFDQVNREVLADKVVSARMEEYYKEFIGTVNRRHKVEILAGVSGEEK